MCLVLLGRTLALRDQAMISGIKSYIYLAIIGLTLTVVTYAVWHYNIMVRDLAKEKSANTILKATVDTQNQTIDSAKANIEEWKKAQTNWQATINELNAQNNADEQRERDLYAIFQKHDLVTLSIKDPDGIEHRINLATANTMLLLECYSGSEDKRCPTKIGTTKNSVNTLTKTHTDIPGKMDSNNQR